MPSEQPAPPAWLKPGVEVYVLGFVEMVEDVLEEGVLLYPSVSCPTDALLPRAYVGRCVEVVEALRETVEMIEALMPESAPGLTARAADLLRSLDGEVQP